MTVIECLDVVLTDDTHGSGQGARLGLLWRNRDQRTFVMRHVLLSEAKKLSTTALSLRLMPAGQAGQASRST